MFRMARANLSDRMKERPSLIPGSAPPSPRPSPGGRGEVPAGKCPRGSARGEVPYFAGGVGTGALAFFSAPAKSPALTTVTFFQSR